MFRSCSTLVGELLSFEFFLFRSCSTLVGELLSFEFSFWKIRNIVLSGTEQMRARENQRVAILSKVKDGI